MTIEGLVCNCGADEFRFEQVIKVKTSLNKDNPEALATRMRLICVRCGTETK